MKKILLIAAGILLCTSPVNNVSAVPLVQANAGDEVTIAVTVPGAQSVAFRPSTNVLMEGNSVATAFAIGALHEQALRKKAGQAYGMASDSNKMYFQDISDETTYVGEVAGTSQATSFTTSDNWYEM